MGKGSFKVHTASRRWSLDSNPEPALLAMTHLCECQAKQFEYFLSARGSHGGFFIEELECGFFPNEKLFHVRIIAFPFFLTPKDSQEETKSDLLAA